MAEQYYVGQGRVLIAPRNASGLTGGFEWVGNVSDFTLTGSEDFLDFNESYSGQRARVVHLSLGKNAGFTMSMQSLDARNIARALHANIADGGAGGGTATGERVMAYAGTSVPLRNPGVTGLTLTAGGTALVEGTDYSVDGGTGMVTFLEGSTRVTGDDAVEVTAAYSYSAFGGTLHALSASNQEFSIRFEGRSQTDNSVMIVDIYRANFDLTGELALIGDDVASLEVTGAILPDTTRPAGQQFYAITRGLPA